MSRDRGAHRRAARGPRRAREPAARRHTVDVAQAGKASDIPRWLVPVAYLLVTIVLFREFVFQGASLLGTDTYALSYFARDFYTSFVRETGQFPLWDPYILGGLPFVEGMHGDIFYPPSLALFPFDARTMWGLKMMLHVLLAGVFAHVWLRSLGLGRGPAFFGGLVYMMGPDLVSLVYPGGDGKLFVSALAPLVFWLAERAARWRRPADFAWFALGITHVVLTSHMQAAYFTVWGVSLYFLFRTAQVWRRGARATAGGMLGAFALSGVLGVGAAAAQFLPPLGYLREWSHRAGKTVEAEGQSGYEYSTTWSIHPEEAVSLIVPEFAGDNVRTDLREGDTYWGRNTFKYNHEYAGLVPLLLVPLLFMRRRTPETWFFSALGVLAVLYALGATTPAFRIFYLIPGVNLFRAPSLIIFLYGLSVATLGAMGLQRLCEAPRVPNDHGVMRRAVWIVAGVLLVLALLESAGLITGLWQSLSPLDERRGAALQANLDNIRNGFWIAFLISAVVAAAWEAVARGLVGTRDAVLGLALLAALDLYRVDRPFIRAVAVLPHDPVLFEADESIRFLQAAASAEEPFRVYDLGRLPQIDAPAYPHPNTLARHGLEQLGGHHGNEIGRYRELVGGDDAFNVAVSQLRLMDLANVRYAVIAQRIQPPPGYEEAFVGSRSAVYRNANALPRAWLAGAVELVPDSEAVARLLAPEFPSRSTVTVAEPLPEGVRVEPGPQGTVAWLERGINAYTLSVTTDRDALLVISENFHPAWTAEVDGVGVPVLRVNHTFRAVPITSGEHTVRFGFESGPLRRSVPVSVALTSLLLLAGLLGKGRAGRREEKV
ncbi:MAG: hypothetical protein L0271_02220 [Gemmatimonadetes bacterium]|nr:hypothetical protein [Gemmatimonadota bacterium]